ncbi:hypothetical protein ES705_31492 [subsurface metagenome]
MLITYSPLVAGASGKTAEAVAAHWKGRNYIRKLVIPRNPKSPAQRAVRESLARCVTLWRSLWTGIKDWLDTYATDYRMAGYNTFVSKNRLLEQGADVLKPVPDNPHAAAPGTFAPVTGVGVAGDIDVTWNDLSPDEMDQIYFVLRLAGTNVFIYGGLPLAADETFTISGLTPDASYDVYAWFRRDDTQECGTAAGALAIAAMA